MSTMKNQLNLPEGQAEKVADDEYWKFNYHGCELRSKLILMACSLEK